MTPERWQRIKDLFQSALELEPGQRTALLDDACVDDESLRAEVDSLLASHERVGSFINVSPLENVLPLDGVAGLAMRFDEKSVEGKRIGAYKIIREIGRGGMGAVYLAVRADDQYRKRVAIKVVKRGMDTESILRRFRSERQILASLDHSNIARLFDGGTTEESLPYFVMEYIEGKQIDEYCDLHQLSTIERLKLFQSVCSAVHYAHQNLIVHRDIKPSNILVTAEGVPKLLDFGIAKLLNPELWFQTIDPTVITLRLMTPEYASPEQVRGEPVTTSSDVYSLGVVLYELLTGHRPYHVKSRAPQEIARAVCDEEPDKPSTAINRIEEVTIADGTSTVMLTPESVSKTREGQPAKLRRSLVGDLDNIVLKAMRKEASRRYLSVQQLSGDIRRHLEGMPVIARRDTFSYRSIKFINRHKGGVIAAAIVIITLFGGIVATAWQARVATAQRVKAERRFNDVRKLANSVLFKYHDAIEKLPGSTPVREMLVRDALDYLDSLALDAGGDPSLQRELAAAYEKVGDVQGNPYYGNLGDMAGALVSYRKALAIREVLASDRMNAEAQRDMAASYERVGDLLSNTSDVMEALDSYRKALTIREALATNGNYAVDRRALAMSYYKVGQSLAWTGDMQGSLDSHRKAAMIRETLAAGGNSADVRQELAVSYVSVGERLMEAGEVAAAIENYLKAISITEALCAQDKTNAKARRSQAISHTKMGEALAATRDKQMALDHLRKGLAIREELVADDRTNAQARRDLAISYATIGNTLSSFGDHKDALENLGKSVDNFKALSEMDPSNVNALQDLVITYNMIGKARAATGDLFGALDACLKALAISEAVSEKDSADVEARRSLKTSYTNLAALYAKFAVDTKTPTGKQIERWREARLYYERSRNVLIALREQGALSAAESHEQDEVAGEIAKCDTAIMKLQELPASKTIKTILKQ